MSNLYELGKNLRGMGDFVKGLSETADDQQAGTCPVGPVQNAYSKACAVRFPKAFAAAPLVLANAVFNSSADQPDTFAVTITQVSKEGFRASVYRVDSLFGWTQPDPKPELGWKQDVSVNWIALPKEAGQ
jgi:hypothetical protein